MSKTKPDTKLMNMRMNLLKLVLSPKATMPILRAMRAAYETAKKK